jgi:hypothetical protein
MKTVFITLLLVGLFIVSGCRPSREQQLIGHWTSSLFTGELRQDKSFTMTSPFVTLTGTWELQDAQNQVIFRPDSETAYRLENLEKDQPMLKQIAPGLVEEVKSGLNMSLSEDNKMMTTSLAGQTIEMQKQESKQ